MKRTWRVIFWHNDFPENCVENVTYGKNGFVYNRVMENIPSRVNLEWFFFGGYLCPRRIDFFESLKKADVLIAFCPWNMDRTNNDMHWPEAEESTLKILREARQTNDKLKTFFLLKPRALVKELQSVGELVDIDDDRLYKHFSR